MKRTYQKTHTVTDHELTVLTVCSEQLRTLCFDQTWRVMHYLLARHMGRNWTIAKPQNG